jgi:hypothetical protein
LPFKRNLQRYITGGAPELMEQFRPLVLAARERGGALHVGIKLTHDP